MLRLGRRALALLAAGRALCGAGRAESAAPQLSIADVSNDVSVDLRDAETRLAIYKDLGFAMVRTAVVWSEFERRKGEWRLPAARQKYLELIARSGLRLKLEVSALHSAPGWFFDENPRARPRNAEGRTARQLISVWYPQVNGLVAEKQEQMVASLASLGVVEHIAAWVAALGPAGEPIYPAPWQTEGGGALSFWYHDEYARPHFAARMEARFGGDLDAANARWRSAFKSWGEVDIPAPGAARGARWEDVLLWYRDSKREVVAAALNNILAQAGADRPVVMLVPGAHTTDAQWRDAVASGGAAPSMMIMTDTDFLLDLAKQTGAWLQHTAAQNEAAIRYLLDGMKARGFATPLWAENSGGTPALDPGHLAEMVLRNRLYGLDYIGGGELFGPDRITPGPVMERMKAAAARLRTGSAR